MKDSLVISDRRAVPHGQSVVAPLQVKVLESQLDHLQTQGHLVGKDIAHQDSFLHSSRIFTGLSSYLSHALLRLE